MAYKITYSSGTVKWLDGNRSNDPLASVYCRDVARYDTILDISACVARIDIDSPIRGQYGYNSVLFAGVGGKVSSLASSILAKCAFNDGLMIKQSRASWHGSKGRKRDQPCPFREKVYSPLIPRGRRITWSPSRNWKGFVIIFIYDLGAS